MVMSHTEEGRGEGTRVRSPEPEPKPEGGKAREKENNGMGMGNDAEHAQMAFKAGIDWIQCGSDWSYMVEFADHFYGRIRGA